MKTRVLLVDDHTIVIDGLKAILEGSQEFKIVGEANDGQEVLELLENGLNVDVIIMDINMPIMDGFTCSKKLKSTYPDVKIIILTMHAQKSFIDEIIKIGIDGCLLKNNTGKELKDAINRVSQGKYYYDLVKSFEDEQNKITHYKLGERELEIIRLIAKGFTSQQIAERLFISEHTVKTHRKNILKKTEMKNTSQLIQYAAQHKLI